MTVDFEPNSARPKRVLISYSQESDEHRARIRKLADQLRADGIDAMIDQYEPHPPEGWPMWMERQIKGADFVVIVFTETYGRRANGHEQAGRGLGVAWEADLIRNALFNTSHQNSRFIPVVFRSDDETFVMDTLKSVTRYVLDEHYLDATLTSNGYGLLCRQITSQPLVKPPPVGRQIKLDAINGSAVTQTAASVLQPGPGFVMSSVSQPVASKGTVLMAEARADVKGVADDFTRFLRESGYEVVVPETFSVQKDIRPSFEAALRECLLVVQVLGADPFPKSKFLEGQRYEQWIRQHAQASQKSVLSWRPPSLDVSLIVDEDY
ncbi:MAG: toll/interleukin-1 receptor domain-containing protein, partial [Planctomycetaceae bacterium]|nr:toll/interleukin-1 receptor domain-containing protein [Planctomycetaceae bacterium]